jgi:hypothetical protein
MLAQPIPLEVFMSDGNFLTTTMTVSRPFSKESKYRILNISSFEAHKESEMTNSSVMITDVTYSFFKGLGAGIGLTYNSVSGLAPTLGLAYGMHGKRYSLTVAPAYIFSSTNSVRIILNGMYKPRINDKLNGYLSASNLFTYGLNGDHVRSYQKLRIGFDYRTFQFGFGVNFDQFGINQISNTHFGAFLRKEF